MGKKLTQEEFIEKAKAVHGDKYDYSKVEYKSSKHKVCIICPEHGEFYIWPVEHTKGRGCFKCAEANDVVKLNQRKLDFIEKSKTIHNNFYDYSKVNYTSYHSKVCIICPIHGEFWQRPSKHLIGQKCPLCAKENRTFQGFTPYTTQTFITKAKEIHGDKYDYSNVEYINSVTKVCIMCPIHGEFWQTPSEHLYGYGCRMCADEKYIMGKELFIEKARRIHGDKYDYSKVDYKHSKKKVCIICPIHGEFWQSPRAHLHNRGCSQCTQNKQLTTETFIEKSKQIHGDIYDYSLVNYVNNHTNIIIICREHGPFKTQPSIHLSGSVCPACAALKNVLETRLYEQIKKTFNNTEWYHSYRNNTKLGHMELDIYNPQYKIAVEYQGKQHFEPVEFFGGETKFTRQVQLDKRKMVVCEENNISLFHFSYDIQSVKYSSHYTIYTSEDELFKEIDKIIKGV